MAGNYFIKNIHQLLQVREEGIAVVKGKDMQHLPHITNAWLVVTDGRIAAYGKMEDVNATYTIVDGAYTEIDAQQGCVMPAYCDAHTHTVFAGWRVREFADRLHGVSYQDIAARGGGILNSARLLHDTHEDILFEQALIRLQDMQAMGTGAVEIKSGYGLTFDSELKILRVIKRLQQHTAQTIRATFLGAHAIPAEYTGNREGYLRMLIEKLLPQIADEGLADYCDIFCEQNYFTADDTMRLLEAAAKYGIKGKVHAEQLSYSGGIAAGVKSGATSVDHLEYITEADIELLKQSSTMPVLLPGAAFFLNIPQPPARQMIDAGLPVALSTDFNPGTSPSGNMNMMLSFASVQMRMTPAEAFNAATINSAYAMGVSDTLGSITIGKRAHLIITKPHITVDHIPYLYASTSFIERVILG